MKVEEILIACYYDGLTLGAAINFITRCYSQAPNEKQIAAAVNNIESCYGQNWRKIGCTYADVIDRRA